MTSAGLPPSALLLVLASAMVHASWNVLLAWVPRGHDTTAVGLAQGLIAWAPLALARWRADGGRVAVRPSRRNRGGHGRPAPP